MALLPSVADCVNGFFADRSVRYSEAACFSRIKIPAISRFASSEIVCSREYSFCPSASWNYCAQYCIRVVRLQEDECYLQNHRKNDTDIFSYINVFSRF